MKNSKILVLFMTFILLINKRIVSTSNENIKSIINAHTLYRSLHGSKSLFYAPALAQQSQQHADHLAKSGNDFYHSNMTFMNLPIGENMAWWTGFSDMEDDGSIAVNIWYKEIINYNFNLNVYQPLASRFSQLIWKDSLFIGIGMAKNINNVWIVVCNYYPPGNIDDPELFKKNVSPLKFNLN
jgi:uncharacterized protein YkwD